MSKTKIFPTTSNSLRTPTYLCLRRGAHPFKAHPRLSNMHDWFCFGTALRVAALIYIQQSVQLVAHARTTVPASANDLSSSRLSETVPNIYVDRCTQIRHKLLIGMTKPIPSVYAYISVLDLISIFLCPVGLPALPLSIVAFCVRVRVHSAEPYRQLRTWSVTPANIILVDRICALLVDQPLLNPNAISAFMTVAQFAQHRAPLSWLPIAISAISTLVQIIFVIASVVGSKFFRNIPCWVQLSIWQRRVLGFLSKPNGKSTEKSFETSSETPLQSLRRLGRRFPTTNSTQSEHPFIFVFDKPEDHTQTNVQSVPGRTGAPQFMPIRVPRPTFVASGPHADSFSDIFDDDAHGAEPIA